MSGGDFVNSGERVRLLQRGIEDRVRMVRDLRRIMDVHGAESAAIMLGCLGSGELFGIVEGRLAIQAQLLETIYGPRGGKLKACLTTAPKQKAAAIVSMGGASKALAVPKAPVLPGCDAATLAKPPVARAAPVPPVIVPAKPAAPALPVAAPAVAKPAPGPIVGTRDRDANERKVLGEVGTTREALVAILQRARKACGTLDLAADALGIGRSTIQNLAGNHSKFSTRTAMLLLKWDAENPATALRQAQDERLLPPEPIKQNAAAAGAAVVVEAGDEAAAADAGAAAAALRQAQGEGEAVPPLDPPPATVTYRIGIGEAVLPFCPPNVCVPQDSPPALSLVPHPPEAAADLPCAGGDGAVVLPPAPPPQTAANDDPFAVALTAMVKARDAATAARLAIRAELVAIDAQIAPLQARRKALDAEEDALLGRLSVLCNSVDHLQAVAK